MNRRRTPGKYPQDIVDRILADYEADAVEFVLNRLDDLSSDRFARCALFVAHGSLKKLKEVVEAAGANPGDLISAAEIDSSGKRVRSFDRPFSAL